MNFIDTMASVELVLAANQVPLLVGETGIGKTSLAVRVAEVHNWELVTIDTGCENYSIRCASYIGTCGTSRR